MSRPVTTSSPPITPSQLPISELQDFFDRIAARDYDRLSKELCIPRTISRYPSTSGTPLSLIPEADHLQDTNHSFDADTSVRSTDSTSSADRSFRFQATPEGLRRAASIVRGGADDPASSDHPARAPTPAEEEAFQFTFRHMIHKLYSLGDFARMVADVVAASQARYRPLERDGRGRLRRESISRSFAWDAEGSFALGGERAPGAEEVVECESMVYSPESAASSVPLPRSPPASVSDGLPVVPLGDEDVRAVKKRIVGRRLSISDGADDEQLLPGHRGTGWVYDAAVASVDSSTYFDMSFSPTATSSPAHVRVMDEGDCVSPRKRRFSFLSSRGL